LLTPPLTIKLLTCIHIFPFGGRPRKPIYILYGSQTGNAESLAAELSDKLNEEGILNICSKLNEAKGVSLKTEASFAVILCSTTGNGDAPENADGWWRSIKLRSAVRSIYHGVLFPF
jgi:sulfite reductase (NADPH) flavoprotein alpha-component